MRRSHPRTPRRSGRPIVVVLAVAVAVLLAGCAGGTGGQRGAPSPGTLPHYDSAAALGAAIAARQRTDRTSKINMTSEAAGQHITGEGVIRFEDSGPSLAVTEHLHAANNPEATSEIGLVVLADQAFVKPPPGTTSRPLPAGKSWLAVAPNSGDPIAARFAQQAQSMRQSADAASLSQYGPAASIVNTTDEPLDGTPTVRYQVQLNLAKAVEVQQNPAIKQSLASVVAAGIATVDIAIWLDALDHPLRALVRQILPGSLGRLTVDMRYRDWGQPIQITPPPADRIAQG